MMPDTYKRYASAVGLVLLFVVIYLYFRPIPFAQTINKLPAAPKTQAVALPWPDAGQAALGAEGYGVLASHNTAAPVPIGSTAKVITTLAVLKQKPIASGSQGPTITLGPDDVALFNSYYARNGSVSAVEDGEQITELQAIEAMLIPSSNNMADSLAEWAFGSIPAYISYADKMVKGFGLENTHVGDTNGFSDTTTSTADDLVKLGLMALKSPVISAVVGQSSAQLPVAGTVTNFNSLLGTDGVVGIKTGNTEKAGGCYLFAARHQIHGQNVTLVGAILGAPDLADAISGARPLLQTVDGGFSLVTPVKKGQLVAMARAPWGSASKIVAAKDIPLLVWDGRDIKLLSEPGLIKSPDAAGTQVGRVIVQSGGISNSSSLILANNLSGPDWRWRIFHK